MENLYSWLTRWLIKNTNGSEKEYEIYKYGFQSAIEQLVFITTCIAVALFLNSLVTMLLFLLVFYLLRPYIGGFHFKKYIHCYISSVAVAIAITQGSKLITTNLMIFALIATLVLLVNVICSCNSIEKKDYVHYVKKVILHLCIVWVLLLWFNYHDMIRGVNTIAGTIIVVCTTSLRFKDFCLISNNK
ncbi:MAG: accessory gene regulator B family protein [Eubacteriales bacterium]